MKLTKNDLMNYHKKAWEILSFVLENDELIIKDKTIDINELVFSSEPYPFDLSFDELLSELDEVFEDSTIDDILNKLGEGFINTYINYVKNTISPIYNKLANSDLEKLYLIEFKVCKTIENHLKISELAVLKHTPKRIYYYETLDNESTKKDVKILNKELINKVDLELRGNIIAKAWCLEKDKEKTISLVQDTVANYLKDRLNSLKSYKLIEKTNIKL